MKLKDLLKEITATDRYSKHGYTPDQVIGISDYFKRLNLIKLVRTSVNGRSEFYWVKSVNDKLPVVYYDENKLVHVDDNVVKDIIRKIKPAFGSPETSGERKYNPPYVAFGNAVMEWVAQQLKISDAELDKRLSGTNPLSPFNPNALHSRSRTVPDDATKLTEAISNEAAQLHAMTSCGQDAAQDFFDENNIDAKALVTYVQRNKPTDPTLIYDIRDYISGAKGTVGGEKKLRDKFIKQFQLESPIKEGVSWKPSSNANVEGFASKSFPYAGKGDALLSKSEFINKWSPKIKAWIGIEPKLDQVDEFFPTQRGMDFKFKGSDGKTYRIYSPGESARSKQYIIQKLK